MTLLLFIKILACVAILADGYFTLYRGRHAGLSFREANPILRWLASHVYYDPDTNIHVWATWAKVLWYAYWPICCALAFVVPFGLFAIAAVLGSGYWSIRHYLTIRKWKEGGGV